MQAQRSRPTGPAAIRENCLQRTRLAAFTRTPPAPQGPEGTGLAEPGCAGTSVSLRSPSQGARRHAKTAAARAQAASPARRRGDAGAAGCAPRPPRHGLGPPAPSAQRTADTPAQSTRFRAKRFSETRRSVGEGGKLRSISSAQSQLGRRPTRSCRQVLASPDALFSSATCAGTIARRHGGDDVAATDREVLAISPDNRTIYYGASHRQS